MRSAEAIFPFLVGEAIVQHRLSRCIRKHTDDFGHGFPVRCFADSARNHRLAHRREGVTRQQKKQKANIFLADCKEHLHGF